MKFLLLFVIALLPRITRAQKAVISNLPADTATGQILYQGVVQAPGISKAELFYRARNWFAMNFADYRQVVSIEDSTSGEIVGTYSSVVNKRFLLAYNHYAIYRTLKISVAAGRYQYELTNFRERNIQLDNQFYAILANRPLDISRFGTEIASQSRQNIDSLQEAMHHLTKAAAP